VEFEYITKKTYTVPTSETAVNLAQGATVQASVGDGALAVDGDTCSLWNAGQNGATITLDLGSKRAIGKMTLSWYAIHTSYLVQLSDDGKSFTDYKVYVDGGSGCSVINLFGAEARYIRIKILRADNQGIYEWRVFEATDADKNSQDPFVGENLALGKPVTATNVEGGNKAALAVDGKYDTRWSAQQSGGAALTVDLQEVKTIRALQMMLESAYVPYCIEYSTDGETYSTLFEGKKDQLLVELTDLDAEARYVRVRRDGENSNAAFLVSLTPEDFGSDDPLAGIALQKKIEERAFSLSGSYKAPCQRMEDFAKGRKSVGISEIRPSYPIGTEIVRCEDYLPSCITDSLRAAIYEFEDWMPGFYCPDSPMTGPETRSTSPVRVERGEDFSAVGIEGLYPVGEGAGYSGGIISSARDGVMAALHILNHRK
jgi:hypothetical protein